MWVGRFSSISLGALYGHEDSTRNTSYFHLRNPNDWKQTTGPSILLVSLWAGNRVTVLESPREDGPEHHDEAVLCSHSPDCRLGEAIPRITVDEDAHERGSLVGDEQAPGASLGPLSERLEEPRRRDSVLNLGLDCLRDAREVDLDTARRSRFQMVDVLLSE